MLLKSLGSLPISNVQFNVKNDPEYIKLAKENAMLKDDNETLKRNLDDKKEDFEKCKSQYQDLVKIQTDLIKKGEQEIIEKKSTIEEINLKLNQAYEKVKKFDIDKLKWESKINELLKDNKSLASKIENLESLSEDKSKMIETYQENLMRHEKESANLAQKLAELKNAVFILIIN